MRILAIAVAVLITAACAQAPQVTRSPPVTAAAEPVAPASAWLADVQAIADADAVGTTGDDASAGRRRVIEQRLDALGIVWRTVGFDSESARGENLLADVAGGLDSASRPILLLGAHFDKVGPGQGATDNASGVATVLALGQRFKQRPLTHHGVALAFWDLEELGLLGARAHVARGGTRPALYVNFDVFGWGDALWMMTPDAKHPLVAASRIASASAGLTLAAGAQYPPTDHHAFLDAGWPAVSYSLVGGDEINAILEFYAGRKPESMPKVMQVIHSENDTVAQIDADAAARGVDAVEDALRRWDAVAAAAAGSR